MFCSRPSGTLCFISPNLQNVIFVHFQKYLWGVSSYIRVVSILTLCTHPTAVALSCPSLLYWDLYHLYILTIVYTHVTHSCQTKVMSAQEQSRYSKWTFAFCPEHLLLLFFLSPPLVMLAWGLSLYLVWLPSSQHGPCTSCVSLFIAPLPSADVCEGDNTD